MDGRIMVRYAASRKMAAFSDHRHAVYGPSGIPYADIYPKPKAATEEYLLSVEDAFVEAVERCKEIGCKYCLMLKHA